MPTLNAYNVTLFGLEMEFDPVAFTIPVMGGWSIFWYGICIAIGFLLAVVYCFQRAKRFDVDIDRLTDVVLITTPLAIICARVYYIIFYPGNLKINSIGDFFGIAGSSGVSGLAIYGAVIGAAVFGLLACKIRKVKFLDALDLAASGFLIAQSIGRWGNFFNQEAFGSLTGSSWWGMQSEATIAELGEGLVHPCFLYESIWCLLGFILLHFIGNRRKYSGQLSLCYGVWYGLGRMIIETFRTDSLYLGPLKVSQWLSGVLVIVCAILLIYNYRKSVIAKVDTTYEPMFDDIDPSSIKGVSYYEGEETEKGESDEAAENEAAIVSDTDNSIETEKSTDKEEE
ncbi:MAG: prolipoprotein diacylglyceryl transferase [Clostridia bacterium]|nr:prolipoprotein diacylglyceryl transferase [Clostridia bacterium]